MFKNQKSSRCAFVLKKIPKRLLLESSSHADDFQSLCVMIFLVPEVYYRAVFAEKCFILDFLFGNSLSLIAVGMYLSERGSE